MASFNRVIMIGNLTRDPDYKVSPSGQPVCRLSVASNRQFRNKQTGLMVQEVCFIDVDVWGNQAENCRQYLQKGRPVLVEGRLKFDTWESDGQVRRRHSIVADRVVFLGSNQQSETSTLENNQYEVPNESFQSSGEYEGSKRSKTVRKSKKPEPDELNVSSDTNNKEDSQNNVIFKDEQPFEDDLPF